MRSLRRDARNETGSQVKQTLYVQSPKALNLWAKYNVHVIAIKHLIPENFILVPPADFVIKDNGIMPMLGVTEVIRRIKAL
ncbi:MAG: hypothetical protein AB7E47_00600 [Desulfovibrionaceae bacterium]